jgi:transcriptional regulator with PAS, ATPase and Fis domain
VADETERTSTKDRARAPRVEAFLFLVIEGARLDGGGLRVSLSGIDELTIGRGEPRSLKRTKTTHAMLAVPDARMSTTHAQVIRRDGWYFIHDADSTNGTQRNGAPVDEAKLSDGDLLELGQTLFQYREIVDEEARAPSGDLDPSTAPPQPMGLTTLDPKLAKRFARLARVAASPLSTMLLGETGTGKEVLARAIHQLSKRPGPFVAVNCGAIPQNLVESHLFGHVKGSFSGATRDEPGLVRAAHGGTLLLDEIGDLPSGSQAALLRVLQEGEVLPVGSAQPVKVDVRIVSATHQPLDALVEKGVFRRDLYARLAGYTFAVPPLRDRMVDLGLLVAAVMKTVHSPAKSGLRLHREAVRAMARYAWPMNVRELEQCLRASGVLAEDGIVTPRELPAAIADALTEGAIEAEEGATPDDDDLRRELLMRLADARGNVSEVARAMGKARQQIQRWLRRLDIDSESFRGGK